MMLLSLRFGYFCSVLAMAVSASAAPPKVKISLAQTGMVKLASPEQMEYAKQKNIQWLNEKKGNPLKSIAAKSFQALRPVKDDDDFRYLITSADTTFETEEFKSVLAKNLPEKIKLVLLAKKGREQRAIDQFSQWISKDRIIVMSIPVSGFVNTFWARDWSPYPVYKNEMKEVGLISSLYDQHTYYVDQMESFKRGMARDLHASFNAEEYYFVGGNLLADSDGTCFAVRSTRFYNLNADILKESYGCRDSIILPHLSGIGDVDEVVKILPGKVVLTNLPEYKPLIEEKGYRVVMLPGVDNNVSKMGVRNLGTYANSVILDQKVFMPAYGRPSDEVAKAVYEDLGYEVFTANSKQLSFEGMGSFHCATMGYPQIELETLAKMLGTEIYEKASAKVWSSPADLFDRVLEYLM